MLTYFLFAIGFVLLILGADWLINGAAALAQRLKISEMMIGLTVVAFGTSASELAVNIVSSSRGLDDLVIGNILGSNIVNILLVLGLASLIYPLVIKDHTLSREIPANIVTAVILMVLLAVNLGKSAGFVLSRVEGLILLGCFAYCLNYLLHSSHHQHLHKFHMFAKNWSIGRAVIFLMVGSGALIVGSQWVVNGALQVARQLHLSEAIIGLTIVSIGTSLPELVTSAWAAYNKRIDLAVGNIIGSNLFNILLVLGVSAVVRPVAYNPRFNFDLGVLLVATMLLFACMFIGKKNVLERWQGGILLGFYFVYILMSVVRVYPVR